MKNLVGSVGLVRSICKESNVETFIDKLDLYVPWVLTFIVVAPLIIGVIIGVGAILWLEFAPSNAESREEHRRKSKEMQVEYDNLDCFKFVGPRLPDKPVDWAKLGLAVWNGTAWVLKKEMEIVTALKPSDKAIVKTTVAATLIGWTCL